MIDRIRALLDRPLDHRHARMVVALASALTLAFATLVSLGVIAGARSTSPTSTVGAAPLERPTPPPPLPGAGRPAGSIGTGHRHPPEGPQDVRGEGADDLGDHRALQHVPYRRGGIIITLGGTAGRRPVVRVTARSASAARRAWRRFLRRFHDDGRAYRVRFVTEGRHR